MISKLRSNSFTALRLLFLALFLILGITSIGIILLEQYADISIIAIKLETDRKAFYAALSFIGVSGLFTSSLMLYLMLERRDSDFNRRQQSKQPDFVDRRENPDRRCL